MHPSMRMHACVGACLLLHVACSCWLRARGGMRRHACRSAFNPHSHGGLGSAGVVVGSSSPLHNPLQPLCPPRYVHIHPIRCGSERCSYKEPQPSPSPMHACMPVALVSECASVVRPVLHSGPQHKRKAGWDGMRSACAGASILVPATSLTGSRPECHMRVARQADWRQAAGGLAQLQCRSLSAHTCRPWTLSTAAAFLKCA